MKKTFVAVLLAIVVTTSTGCAAWYQQFKNNPVQFVDDFNSKTDIIVSDLSNTFEGVLAFLPPEEAVKARQDWMKGVSALSLARKALRDGVDAAVAAQESTPNWGRLVADVVSAVQNIIRIVDIFKSNGAVVAKMGSVSATGQDPFVVKYIATYGAKK